MNSGVDGAANAVLGLLSVVLLLGVYVWVALALAAMFRKMGEESWRGWVPFLNIATVLKWGGFSPWLVLLALIPGVGQLAVTVLLIISAHRLGPGFGYGGGMTVLAAFLFPVWATILGFGPAPWRGARTAAIRPGAVRPPTGASPPYAPFSAAPPASWPTAAAPAPPPAWPAPGPGAGSSAPQPWPAAAPTPPPAWPTPSPSAAPPPAPPAPLAPQPWAPPPPSAPRTGPEAPTAPPAATAGRGAPASAVPSRLASEDDRSASKPVRPASLGGTPHDAPAGPMRTSPATGGTPVPRAAGAVDGSAASPEDSGDADADARPQSTAPTPTIRSASHWHGDGDVDEVSAVFPAPFPPSSAAAARPFVSPPVSAGEEGIISRVPGPAGDAPVTRLPAPAASDPAGDDERDVFPELTGEVSAVVGSPAAGSPKSASSSVSAQQRDAGGYDAARAVPATPADDAASARREELDDELDRTVMVRRKRGVWELVPPSGTPIPLEADVVILGRHPVADPAHPAAQLVTIIDPTRTVSKTHARLERRGDAWHIVDLHSTNGVLLPSLLGTDIELEPGTDVEVADRFLLGDAALRLQRIELGG